MTAMAPRMTDSATQTVTIPSTATTANLLFWLHIDTAETTTTTAFDVLTVQVLNSANTVIGTLGIVLQPEQGCRLSAAHVQRSQLQGPDREDSVYWH